MVGSIVVLAILFAVSFTGTSAMYSGHWSHWTPFTACTKTCGAGDRHRLRHCVGGLGCVGHSFERQVCNPAPCGQWSQWHPWMVCSRTCGGGTQKRIRICIGSTLCPGHSHETRPCNPQICSQWHPWAPWTACTRSCGTGQQFRVRVCLGTNCLGGQNREDRNCNFQICPKFTPWTPWTICSKTCGPGGSKFRTRVCIGAACIGHARETLGCYMKPCEYQKWGTWMPWGVCSKTCGPGLQTRNRVCLLGGNCPGLNRETRACSIRPICDLPLWGQWTPWVPCSKTCGPGGQQFRTRACIRPHCVGPTREDRHCFKKSCDLVYKWSPWTPFSACTKTCGSGQRLRYRTCIGGANCLGSHMERQICNPQMCPLGHLSPWTAWLPCSKTCGSGQRARTRICIGGSGRCIGHLRESLPCNPQPCHMGHWSPWHPWIPCSKTCGVGQQSRIRTCIGPFGSCIGHPRENRVCHKSICPIGHWSPWHAWTPCSKTCGVGGKQLRNRVCIGTNPGSCPGLAQETRVCNPHVCPHGEWNPWLPWTPCSKSCGTGGQQTRTRICRGTPGTCIGLARETKICGNSAGGRESKSCGPSTWMPWLPWLPCTASCGGGIQIRARFCSSGLISSGCQGYPFQKQNCNLYPCVSQSNPSWASWSVWSKCSKNCGLGIMERSRNCSGGKCEGRAKELKTCLEGLCEFARDLPLVSKIEESWSEWSACTVTCGFGVQKRQVTCAPSARDCFKGSNRKEEVRPCNIQNCESSDMLEIEKAVGNFGFSNGSDIENIDRTKPILCNPAPCKIEHLAEIGNDKFTPVSLENSTDLAPRHTDKLNPPVSYLNDSDSVFSESLKSTGQIDSPVLYVNSTDIIIGDLPNACNMTNVDCHWSNWTECSSNCTQDGVKFRYQICDFPFTYFSNFEEFDCLPPAPGMETEVCGFESCQVDPEISAKKNLKT